MRLHSECFTGDLLGSLRCDCGPQLHGAIRRMAQEGAGVLLYLAQEGRGIGLANKLRAYALQDRGLDTLDANRALGFEPDERSFAVAATMLRQLGVTRLRLLTNNPDKLAALGERGIDVVGREEHAVAPNGINDHYLATKLRGSAICRRGPENPCGVRRRRASAAVAGGPGGDGVPAGRGASRVCGSAGRRPRWRA